jgi:hypothetical protein
MIEFRCRFFFKNSLYLSVDLIRSDIDEIHRKERIMISLLLFNRSSLSFCLHLKGSARCFGFNKNERRRSTDLK